MPENTNPTPEVTPTSTTAEGKQSNTDPHLRKWNLKTRIMFRLVYYVIRLLNATYRFRVFGMEHRIAAEKHHPKKVFAIATWHGNSFAGTIGHAWQNFSPLCSHSKDGSMVAFLCDHLGLKPVRGSSSRGGGDARALLLSHLEDGNNPAITVDGPKGPIYKTKPGIIAVAKAGHCAILPLCAMGEKNWVLRSWDKLHIPKPFSRVAIVYGPVITVPSDIADEQFEEKRQAIDTILNSMQAVHSKVFDRWNEGAARIQNK